MIVNNKLKIVYVLLFNIHLYDSVDLINQK